ncbi:hypothetical protein [Brevibacterium samyangense]|uniref:DUF4439 domain-containing protein n=1 Tax=Brevibacterium samyangense TaxID=366888 RepID=A0ABN2TD52_9MICO
MRAENTPPHLRRRTVLAAAATGVPLLLAALTGCTGTPLRWDTPPDIPTPSASDEVRNAVATVLAHTSANEAVIGSDTALTQLSEAVGPVWAPPVDPRSPSASGAPTASPTEQPREYRAGLTEVVTTVSEGWSVLDPSLTPVLADVMVGAFLSLRAVDGPSAAALLPRFEVTRAAAPGESAAVDVTALVDALRTAHFAYERLAVFLDAESAHGAAARARLDSLSASAHAAETVLVDDLGGAPVPDVPVRYLPTDPTDAQSALAVAVTAEDTVCAALPAVFGSAAPAQAVGLRALRESAEARAGFAGGPQVLRFTVSGATPAPTDGAGATSEGDGSAVVAGASGADS